MTETTKALPPAPYADPDYPVTVKAEDWPHGYHVPPFRRVEREHDLIVIGQLNNKVDKKGRDISYPVGIPVNDIKPDPEEAGKQVMGLYTRWRCRRPDCAITGRKYGSDKRFFRDTQYRDPKWDNCNG